MSKIRKGDKVKVISGKDKGSIGIVQSVAPKTNKIMVENVNMVTKHVKATRDAAGSIKKVNKPIHISNVVLIDPKSKDDKTTRVGYKIVDGKKYRFSKKSNELVDK